MKYYLGFTLLFAGGFVAYGSTTDDASMRAGVTKTSEKFTRKFSDDKLPQDRLYRAPRKEPAAGTDKPIPALILPNNVCVINTDMSPDRTIEEHIVACIKAYKIRQSLTR